MNSLHQKASALVIALCASSALTGTAAAHTETPEPPTAQWEDCGTNEYVGLLTQIAQRGLKPEHMPAVESLDCGTVNTPLDHSGRQDGTMKVGFLRVPATKTKRGTLFVNPGGPASSAMLFALKVRQYLEPEIWQHYDIVGIDPRGVGEHSHFTCTRKYADEETVVGLEKILDQSPLFPHKAGDFVKYHKSSRIIRHTCTGSDNPFAAYMTTADVAKDMDRVRQALGEEQLNFLGVSYGTYLGTTYASLFPNKARAMILDSAIDANAYAGVNFAEALRRNTWDRIEGHVGKQESFERVLKLCVAAGKCESFDKMLADHKSAYTAVRERNLVVNVFGAERALDYPMYFSILDYLVQAGPRGQQMVPDYIKAVVQAANQDGAAQVLSLSKPDLRQAVQAAVAASATSGKASPLSAFRPGSAEANVQQSYADKLAGKKSAAQAPQTRVARQSLAADEGVELGFKHMDMVNIICTDSVNSPSWDSWMQRVSRLDQEYPGFGPLWSIPAQPCHEWPYRSAGAFRGPFNRPMPGGALVLNTTHDSSTPLRGAKRLHQTLANSALVTVDAIGHGALVRNACARKHATNYLLSGQLPAGDQECAAEVLPFQD